MMKLQYFISLASIVLLGAGCASQMVHRGVIAMKMSDTEAHVGMGSNEIKAGDHIKLYRNVCTGGSGRRESGTERTCRKESLGHGKISKILTPDYSVVEFPAGTKFSEGDTIEKHAH